MKWIETTEYEFLLEELPNEQYSEIVTGICEKIDPTFYEDGRIGFSHEWADDSQFGRTWPLSDLVKTAVGREPESAQLASMLAEVEAAAEILKAAMTPNPMSTAKLRPYPDSGAILMAYPDTGALPLSWPRPSRVSSTGSAGKAQMQGSASCLRLAFKGREGHSEDRVRS